jgi:alkylglycerol monooxygenase
VHEKIITLATPVFFILIGVEIIAARLLGRRVYHVNDAIASLSLGIVSQLVGVFARFLDLGAYAWVATHLALFRLSDTDPLVWAAALVGYDLCYYWLHRLGHETTLLWAAHVVHHQSEDYNLSTALRQTGSGALFGWLFYMPLALLGVPFTVFAVVALIDLLYQFWIHTELIGEHPVLDRIFATPSNHRVHHAVNDRYVDRNYGGLFIIWDRLFGTFEPERADDPPQYGTRSPLRSFNPLWANVEIYWGALRDAWHTRSLVDAVRLWFKPPGWRPADVAERFPKPPFSMARERFNPPLGHAATAYCAVQFVVMLAMAVHFLDLQAHAELPPVIAYFAYQFACLMVLGALLEGRQLARYFEAARLVLTAAGIGLTSSWFGIAQLAPALVAALIAGCVLSLVALIILRPGPTRVATA